MKQEADTSSPASGMLRAKTCLITGAGVGIGRATALAMARAGGKVYVTDVDLATAEETAELIRSSGGAAAVCEHDVADEASWEDCFAFLAEQGDAANVLVNNAGVAIGGPLVDMSLDDWRWAMGINLDGTFLGVKHGIRAMRGHGGAIINVSSVLSLVGRPLVGAVAASKAGILALTRTAALECAARNYAIRVNAVLPGGVDTGIFRGQSWWPDLQTDAGREADARRDIIADTPFHRLANPEEIAAAIVFLASDQASFITGASLAVDGGFSAG
jgi:NAD(P)-dependent dehydrogenase (short-subunit alcohol dehydrogenase family)